MAGGIMWNLFRASRGEPHFFQGAMQEAQDRATSLTRDHPDFLGRVPFHIVEIDGLAFTRAKPVEELSDIRQGSGLEGFGVHHFQMIVRHRIEGHHLRPTTTIDIEISNGGEENPARAHSSVSAT
jgi:hypothetical protein